MFARGCITLVALCFVAAVRAACPANGNTHTLMATFNGDLNHFRNVAMFDTDGHAVGLALNESSVPAHVGLQKLRGVGFLPDGRLGVLSSRGRSSKLVLFSKHLNDDCSRQFDSVFARLGPGNPAMVHPYAFSSSSTHVFVANQNTVTVTRYDMDGSPAPIALAVAAGAAPGTFAEHGSSNYSMWSVRGVRYLAALDLVAVADVDGDRLHFFDARTGYERWATQVPAPINMDVVPPELAALLPPPIDTTELLVTTKSSLVYRVAVRPGAVPRVYTSGFQASSGIAIDRLTAHVYVADRVGRRLRMINANGRGSHQFGPGLLDEPEGLLFTRLVDPATLPTCYELGATGLKYSVLCIAGWFYGCLAVVAVGLAVTHGYVQLGKA